MTSEGQVSKRGKREKKEERWTGGAKHLYRKEERSACEMAPTVDQTFFPLLFLSSFLLLSLLPFCIKYLFT